MMEAFSHLQAAAAPLPIANIDTDMLVPARFLKTVSKQGLAKALFASQRFGPDGAETPDFVLNRQPWRNARILVTLDNFGCGSSREHAPWALIDFGIRCIIAPSFADIFYGNCFKNGILPIALPESEVRTLLTTISQPETAILDIDLVEQTIVDADGNTLTFRLEAKRRERLLTGADDIAITLQKRLEVSAFEQMAAARSPWVKPIPELS